MVVISEEFVSSVIDAVQNYELDYLSKHTFLSALRRNVFYIEYPYSHPVYEIIQSSTTYIHISSLSLWVYLVKEDIFNTNLVIFVFTNSNGIFISDEVSHKRANNRYIPTNDGTRIYDREGSQSARLMLSFFERPSRAPPASTVASTLIALAEGRTSGGRFRIAEAIKKLGLRSYEHPTPFDRVSSILHHFTQTPTPSENNIHSYQEFLFAEGTAYVKTLLQTSIDIVFVKLTSGHCYISDIMSPPSASYFGRENPACAIALIRLRLTLGENVPSEEITEAFRDLYERTITRTPGSTRQMTYDSLRQWNLKMYDYTSPHETFCSNFTTDAGYRYGFSIQIDPRVNSLLITAPDGRLITSNVSTAASSSAAPLETDNIEQTVVIRQRVQ